MSFGLSLGLAVAVWLLAAGATARASERLEVNALEYPWSAIGRLNVGGRGYCSGVLVGERHVLTSAHCLYNQVSRKWWQPWELHFVAGYQRGRYPIHSPIKTAVRADGFVFSEHPEPLKEVDDWALLELADPIGRQAGWLGIEPLTPAVLERLHREGSPMVLAGYRFDRAQVITIDRHCEVLGFLQSSQLIIHTCDALQGDSGAPLLAFENGEARVIALQAITLSLSGRKLSGAVASTVLTDTRRWPHAVAATAAAGLSPPVMGRAPAFGGPVAPTPVVTVAALLRLLGPAGSAPPAGIKAFQLSHGLDATGSPSVAVLGALLGSKNR